MHVVHTPGEARAIARSLPGPLGFVPTMGALHRGHLALIERARAECTSVVASIFVNPLQFAPGEDYERYPRSPERDLALLAEAGAALVYAPTPQEMYPPGFATHVEVRGIGDAYEGAARPGHFAGVALVVLKLLHAIEPAVLYLGQKDAQQAVLLRRMVRDLDLPIETTICATVREPDGLALSSRNVYLNDEQRRAAPSLYRALSAMRAAIEAGASDVEAVKAVGSACIEPPLEIEYLDLVDPATFARRSTLERPALIVAVARAGRTRLLDNLPIPGADGGDQL